MTINAREYSPLVLHRDMGGAHNEYCVIVRENDKLIKVTFYKRSKENLRHWKIYKYWYFEDFLLAYNAAIDYVNPPYDNNTIEYKGEYE